MNSCMKFFAEVALTIVLILILHVIAAILNTNAETLLPGIVCYIFTKLMLKDIDNEDD